MYEKVPLEDDFIFEEEEEETIDEEEQEQETNDEEEEEQETNDEQIDESETNDEVQRIPFDHVEVGPRPPPIGEIEQIHDPKYLIGK